MPNLEETYDIVVVGAGHAGCEQFYLQLVSTVLL